VALVRIVLIAHGLAGCLDSSGRGQIDGPGHVSDAPSGGDAASTDGARDAPVLDAAADGSQTSCLQTGCASGLACCPCTGNCYSPACLSCCMICPRVDAAVAPSCNQPCDRCITGVCCGLSCCGRGEWCDFSTPQPTCRCGTGVGCGAGTLCCPPGPLPGPNDCGSSCQPACLR
jgi:hypothetical protein